MAITSTDFGWISNLRLIYNNLSEIFLYIFNNLVYYFDKWFWEIIHPYNKIIYNLNWWNYWIQIYFFWFIWLIFLIHYIISILSNIKNKNIIWRSFENWFLWWTLFLFIYNFIIQWNVYITPWHINNISSLILNFIFWFFTAASSTIIYEFLFNKKIEKKIQN